VKDDSAAISFLVERLEARAARQNAIPRLMLPDDMLETFSELAIRNRT